MTRQTQQTYFRSLLRYAPWAALSVIMLLTYSNTLSRLLKGLFTYEKGHIIVLLAIGFYLLWFDRKRLEALTPRPAIILGSAITLGSCLVLLFGKLSNTSLLQDISLPLTIMGIIVLFGGVQYIKVTWLPVAFLLFVFGLFDELLGSISIYLQYATAATACGILEFTGMPVALSGHLLQLPHIALDVARSCSGINHITALVAIAIPLAWMTYGSWLPRVALIVAAFLIGIIANGVRVAVIGLWTVDHPGSVHGPHDIFYVTFIFVFGTIVLSVVSLAIKRYCPKRRQVKEPNLIQREGELSEAISPVIPFVASLLILCGAWCAIQLYDPRPVPLREQLTAFPQTLGDWKSQEQDGTDSLYGDMGEDFSLLRVYSNGNGAGAKVRVAYFAKQHEDRKIAGYRTDWLSDQMTEVPVLTNRGEFRIGKQVNVSSNKEPKNVYYWFSINGAVTPSRYEAKMRTILQAVTTRANNGAIVMVSFAKPSGENERHELSFLQQFIPVITAFLNQQPA